MATTYYEKITNCLANNETQLKEFVQAKVSDSCAVNGNWLNASIRHGYGIPGAWKLTSEYISFLVLDKEWDYHKLTNLKVDVYPQVVSFKPPTWKSTFSSVRARDECNVVLWDLHDTKPVPAKDIYAALVPAGCAIELLQVDVKCLGPKTAPIHEGEPTAGPSNTDPRSGDSGEDTPRQPRVVERDSGEDTPRQPSVVEGELKLEQPTKETCPFVQTDVESSGGDIEQIC